MPEKIFQSEIEENWNNLVEDISRIADLYNKTIPKIIVVTKTRSLEEIQMVYDLGIRDFGENYAQELDQKVKEFPLAKWHFIGHLQRRHSKSVCNSADFIHTIDSIKIINRISNLGYRGKTLLQVKISDDLSKHGAMFNRESIRELVLSGKEKNIDIIGLMGIAGLSWTKEQINYKFQRLDLFRQELDLDELSLGMSNDYEDAIRAGSTMIRIGSRIFGSRN